MVSLPLNKAGANIPTMCHWMIMAPWDKECPACLLPIGPTAISMVITPVDTASKEKALRKSLVCTTSRTRVAWAVSSSAAASASVGRGEAGRTARMTGTTANARHDTNR